MRDGWQQPLRRLCSYKPNDRTMPMQTAPSKIARRVFLAGIVVAAVALRQTSGAEATAPKPTQKSATPKKPAERKNKLTIAEVQKLISERLGKNSLYSKGFLLSHSDVEPIFNFLLDRGITIAEDHEELYDSILPDNAQLVRLLKTPVGREFQKKVNGNAAAYDRLERLSWNPDGRKVLEEMIRAKDGYARFEKLSKADLAKLSKKLGADSRTEDFDLPTGHIHTEAELLKFLEKILAQQ